MPHEINQASEKSSTTDLLKADENGKKFVGKHSKDLSLFIYLHKRTIFEVQRDETKTTAPLACIVRIKPEVGLELKTKGRCVVVGVLLRMSCQVGMQQGDYIVYQIETRLQPDPQCTNSVFDLTTQFVTGLPDEWHIPLIIKLPEGLPPSLALRSIPNGYHGSSPLHMTYYVFAYVANAQAVTSTCTRNGVDGAWPRLRLGRRHSKVSLALSKVVKGDIEYISKSIPISSGVVQRKLFFSSKAPISLIASLNRSCFGRGDSLDISLSLRNFVGSDRTSRVAAIRVTIKQLISFKLGTEAKSTIKNTLAVYEGHQDALKEMAQSINPVFETVISFDWDQLIDTRGISQHRQIAIQNERAILSRSARLRSATEDMELAGSVRWDNEEWRKNPFASVSLDRLRFFSVEYYVNVHAVLPWASNLIVRLPFHLLSHPGKTEKAETPSLKDATPSCKELKLDTKIGRDLIALDQDSDDGDDDSDDSSESQQANSADLKLKDDAATEISRTRSEIAIFHGSVLESKSLDGHSLELRLLAERVEISSLFLIALYRLVTTGIPVLRSALTEKGLSNQPRQVLLKFLVTLAEAHAKLLPYASPHRLQDRCESLSQIVDIFDLILVKKGANAEWISQQFTRATIRVEQLISDLPSYTLFVRTMRRLQNAILQRGFGKTRATATLLNEADSSDDEEEGNLLHDRSSLLAELADLFQKLTQQAFSGEYEIGWVKTFERYTQTWILFLRSSINEDELAIGVASYFNWSFLLHLLDWYYLEESERSADTCKLLFASIKVSLRWTNKIESNIPPKYLAINTANTSRSALLEDYASRVVATMQIL